MNTFPSRAVGLSSQCFSSAVMINISKSVFFFSRFQTLEDNRLLQLDPAVDGVFNGPYPIGIDPVNIYLFFFFFFKHFAGGPTNHSVLKPSEAALEPRVESKDPELRQLWDLCII